MTFDIFFIRPHFHKKKNQNKAKQTEIMRYLYIHTYIYIYIYIYIFTKQDIYQNNIQKPKIKSGLSNSKTLLMGEVTAK